MKKIWRNSLSVLLAGVLLLSVLTAGVLGSNADDETTQIPTVDNDTDMDLGNPSEDETEFLPISPGTSAAKKVLYSWDAGTLNGSDVFFSNLTDDSDDRQRWDETAVMYTQQEKKTVTFHSFLNERVVDDDGAAYGLPEQTTIDINIASIKENKERIEDQFGRTAVENLKVDVYPMVDLDNVQAVGLSVVYAYKPGGNGLNPANSGLLRVHASKDGKTWLEDFVSVRSAHILGSGTDANGESVIYYEIFTEDLMNLSGLNTGDTIAMLRILPDGEAGIASGSFSMCALTLTGYATEETFQKTVAAEPVADIDIAACRTAVLDAYKNSGESGLNRVLDAISQVARTRPASIADMLDTVGLRFMDGIAFNANEKVIQLFTWMIEHNLRDAENCEQILADYENITTTEKLLRELNTPQQVFKAYAKCQAGDLLVKVTKTGANQVYLIAQSDPVLSAGGNIVIYDDAAVQASNGALTNSTVTYLDENGEEVTDTFFNLYTKGFAPMVVDVLADETVQPVRVDGHVSVADGVRMAVASNWDVESYAISVGDFQTTVDRPGVADVYTSTQLDEFVESLDPGKYQMSVDVTVTDGMEQPEPIVLAFEVKPTYTVSTGTVENGTVTVSHESGKAGETVTVTATPDEGYRLTAVLVDGVAIAGNSFAISRNHVVSAVFEEEAELFTIYGASMTAANNLKMSFFIRSSDVEGKSNLKAVITKVNADGSTIEQVVEQSDWKVRSNDLQYVSFDDIAAKEMTDPIYVQIVDAEGKPVSEKWTDSIRDYAMRQIEKSENALLKTAMVDMLNYGAMAQDYFDDYNIGDLANSGLTPEQQEFATENVTCTDRRVKGERYYGTSLSAENTLLMTLYFQNLTTDMNAVVTYTDHSGNEHTLNISGDQFYARGELLGVVVDQLAVADARQLVTCKVFDGEDEVARAVDSMESYIARQQEDVFKEIMKFAQSAYNYFHH